MSDDILTPLEQISAKAAEVVKPYAPKLSKGELRHLRHHICLAIIDAESGASIRAMKELRRVKR